ncbi:MAG TPA: response regulator transcription factor [Burkholderiales bacterium]|nr:response regulator transcription factor [Burkholderiales bacterium]
MKILIADDHTLFREGMRHVLVRLADEVQIVEAGDCAQALKAVEDHADIALVLLDLHMPGRDGFAALDTLSRRHPALPIVVLSGSESQAEMRRALDNGAMGFIPKSATAQVMLSALRLVLSGGVYVPPALVRSDAGARAPALTPRQIDVLSRVIEGKPNKIIAGELALTEATVKAHISAVFKALDVTNRTQAARAAERMGLKLSRTC